MRVDLGNIVNVIFEERYYPTPTHIHIMKIYTIQ